jgi:hypothetical protein
LALAENHLIAQLPRKDRLRLLASCESVELLLADELATLGAVTRDAYFPVSGFISLVTHVDAHPGLEVGMVGPEGMLGAQLALGMTLSPLRALVQGPGSAWRIGAPAFRRELADSAALQATLERLSRGADGPTGILVGLPSIPPDRPAAGTLAADEPRPSEQRHLPGDA